MLQAVVFDFDGVIFDSETPEYEAHRRIFDRCGVRLTRDDWCDQIGVWTDDQDDRWFSRVRGRTGAPQSLDAFRDEKRRLFASLASGEPMHGVLELLDALAAARVAVGIASSSPTAWVVPSLDRLGLRARFATVVAAEDVTRRKPAPDLYLVAATRLGASPARTVAIEDSGPGIAAAHAAGMKVVAIPHWLTETHDLAAADLRVGHAAELTIDVLQRLVDDHRGGS